ncbi:hypothetical protein FQR65_LT01936 [Abscondita terminalis]|nr:hypothetical protein FQR65_LT01936 [Abscondita terminalis]
MKMALNGKLLQYVVFCAGSFSMLQCGLHIGWPSPSLPQLLSNTSTLLVSNDEGSTIASMFLFGDVFSALLTIPLVDLIGRKNMLLFTCLPFCASWLLIAYGQSIWELYVARLIAGISDGVVFFCLPLYLAEISNFKVRGFFISGTIVTYLLGVFLANLFGTYFNITKVAFAYAILSFLTIFFYLIIPESPQFYIIRRKNDEGKMAMARFNGEDNIELSFNLMHNSIMEQKSNNTKWRQMITDPHNCRSIGLMIALRMFQQFSGFLGITFYIQTLFIKADKYVSPIVFVTIYYLLQTVGSLVNAAVIDKLGRKPLLLTSWFLIICGLSLETVYYALEKLYIFNEGDYSWLPILGLFVFIVGYTIGLQNIPIVLTGEMFPLHFKAVSTGIINFAYGITGVIASKYFQYTKDNFGLYVPFLTFTIFSICGLGFSFFYLPETKRKTLEEIQKTLTNKQTSNLLDN